jgi:hypothetical protein
MMRTRTKTNPAFYADELRLELAGDPQRLERILSDPDSVDLLTWNVFASLDTHPDRDYLAYRLQQLGGPEVRAPVRISLWTGRAREPLLRPSAGYVAAVRERARMVGGSAASTAELEAPVEVPVRVESPDVLVLVETMLGRYRRGAGGRDRLVELIDAGLDQARRLSKALAVAVVYPSGTPVAAEVSARVDALRDPAALAAELPHRERIPPVVLREVAWQQLLRVWDEESRYLQVAGQPVKAFREHLRARDLA